MNAKTVILLTASTLLSQVPHFSYAHPELSLFSFDAPQVVSFVNVQTAQPLDPEGEGLPSESWREEYTFCGDSSRVIIGGKGNDRICHFDITGKIQSIYEGDGAVNYIYGTTVDSVISLPTDTNLTKYSRIYSAIKNSDGDTVMYTVTATDWNESIPDSEFWDNAHRDTARVYRNEDGTIAGVRRDFWRSNHFHTTPWQKESDSLGYSYTTLPDSTRTVITYSPHPVSGEWLILNGNSAEVTHYDTRGSVVKTEELRWDGSAGTWDSVYRRVTVISGDTSSGIRSEEWLYWGTASLPESLAVRTEEWHYQDNPIFSGTTPVALGTHSPAKLELFTSANSLTITLPSSGNWGITLFDIHGRTVIHREHACAKEEQVSLSSSALASGVFLLQVHHFNSGTTLSQKVIR